MGPTVALYRVWRQNGDVSLAPGARIDRYTLLYRAGRGGMGEVWCARAQPGRLESADAARNFRDFERYVAVKTTLPEHAAEPSFRQMFLDEARIASRIEHENVARVLDIGEEAGVLYLVMEWVAGESLGKMVRVLRQRAENPAAAPAELVPLPVLLRIVSDACAGLHAAHELRQENGDLEEVVHRDVSPANIVVSATGVAKLIDFGIAKARTRLAGETNTGVLKGTVRFMSPEQITAEVIDRRADVWSVGVLLYWVLTGEYPHRGEGDAKILVNISLGRPIEPLPDSVPERLRAVVLRALAYDPADRYDTALALRRDLDVAMLDLGLGATPEDVAEFMRSALATHLATRRETLEAAERTVLNLPPEAVGPESVAPPTPRLLTPAPLPSFAEVRSPDATARLPSMADYTPPPGAVTRSRGPFRLSYAMAGILVASAMIAGLGVAIVSGRRPPSEGASVPSASSSALPSPREAVTTVPTVEPPDLDTSLGVSPSTLPLVTAAPRPLALPAAPSMASSAALKTATPKASVPSLPTKKPDALERAMDHR